MESEDDQIYIPQVKSEMVPKLNQEFKTMDDVATFYNAYAKETGFSIRSHTSTKNKENTTFVRNEYVCFKQGVSTVKGEKRKRGLSCGCRKWESEGLPCRHFLSFLIKVQDVDQLPMQYILKRWTKEARQRLVLDSYGAEIKDNKALFARRTKLLQHATYVIDQAIVSEEASQLLIDSLDAFLETFKVLNVGNGNIESVAALETNTTIVEHAFNEPNQVRAKGCGRRLKKGKETRKIKTHESQGRKCHGCGLYGQSHDK